MDDAPDLTEDNARWISRLSDTGPVRDEAIRELQSFLKKNFRRVMSRRNPRLRSQFDEFTDDCVQEATLRILDNLDSFEGRSRFLVWASRITIRVGLSELRKRTWGDVSLDAARDTDGDGESVWHFPDRSPGPEEQALREDDRDYIRRAVRDHLTDKQRTALELVVFKGVPMEGAAHIMGMNRNALYKLMHDARKSLKKKMIADGRWEEEVAAR